MSNNSGEAIADFLAANGLSRYVAVIVGRAYAAPQTMKPAPDSLRTALAVLGAEAAEAVMVGDSVADVTASVAAGVRVIGYANRPGKVSALTAAGADAVVTGMRDLAEALGRA